MRDAPAGRFEVARDRPALLGGALFTLLAMALAHWPLLLNDGIYWDGWIVHSLARDSDLAELLAMFFEQRNEALGYLHFALGQIGDGVLVYKVIAFACLLASAALARRIGLLSGLTRGEAAFVACLATVFTAFQVQVELIMLPYLICLAAFLGGTVLAVEWAAGARFGITRFCAVAALFLVSFPIFSMVSFYGGTLLLCALLAWRSGVPLRARLPGVALLAALPLLALAKYVLLPPYGQYANYNRIHLDAGPMLATARAFLDNSIWRQWGMQLGVAGRHLPAAALLAALLWAAATVGANRHRREADAPRGTAGGVTIAAFALLLAALAILPYAVVDKPPAASGWETRHALLIGFPVALMLVALGRLLPRPFRIPVAAAILAVTVMANWSVYLGWQIAWIKDRVLMQHLAQDLRALVEANDHLVIREPPGWALRNFYEYQGIVAAAMGAQKWFAVNASQLSTAGEILDRLPKRRYLAGDYTGKGCMLELDLEFAIPPADRLRVVTRYTYLRLLRPDALPAYLSALAPVRAHSLSEQRIADLGAIRNALESFHAAEGTYPPAEGARTVMTVPPAEADDWIGGLSPRFLPKTPHEPRWTGIANRQYIYLSNGADYKIIAHASEDSACATRLHPEMRDPRRADYAFGFWSPGAAGW